MRILSQADWRDLRQFPYSCDIIPKFQGCKTLSEVIDSIKNQIRLMDEMEDWADNNIGSQLFIITGKEIRFAEKEHAALFRLFWS